MAEKSQQLDLPSLDVRGLLRRNQELRKQLRLIVAFIVLGLVLFWLLFPVFWAVEMALKTRTAVTIYPPKFYGFEIQWDNFTRVLTETPLISFIRNGLIIALGITVVSLILGVPHAYSISMYRSKFGDMSFILVTATRLVPPLSILVPFYVVFSRLGLLNTLVAVIIVETAFFEPFVVWIVKGYFDNVSHTLVDSARVDGCTKFQAFYKIMLPIARPGITAATIVTWLGGWNAFTGVFILTTSAKAQNLPVGVLSLATDAYVPWNLVAAAVVIGMIPSVLIATFFHKYLVEGVAA